MLRFIALLCLLTPLRAEVIDRIVVAVGHEVITALQLDEELRVAAFLNAQPITRDRDSRRAAADRLVEQLLVKREMELGHYPMPEQSDLEKYSAQVRSALTDSDPEAFENKLRKYGLSQEILDEHLAMQLTILRFIELRFRPALGISPADVENYYQRELVRWKAEHPGQRPPTLADSAESIRKTLTEQRTDEALDAWLEESRRRIDIVYLDKSLQ
jgi:hypothetical protein